MPATQLEIAKYSALARQTIAKHQKDGVLNKDDTLAEALGKLVRHYRENVITTQDIDYNTEKARLTKEQADKLERERLMDEGETYASSEVLHVVGSILKNITTSFTAIPPKVGPLLIGLTKPAQGTDIVEGFIHEALQGVSEPSDMLGECSKAKY